MSAATTEHRLLGGVRIVLIEDHALVAQSLLLNLRWQGAVASAITPLEAASAIQRCAAEQPDVILLDLDLGPFGDGTDLVGPLAEIGQVVVLTGSTDAARLGGALLAGAAALVFKTTAFDLLVEEILAVLDGDRPAADPERHPLVHEMRRRDDERRDRLHAFESLTDRESEVLAALVRGRQVEDMTHELFVTETTVRTHVRGILRKLDVRSQLAAVARAHEAGWLPSARRPARELPAQRPATD